MRLFMYTVDKLQAVFHSCTIRIRKTRVKCGRILTNDVNILFAQWLCDSKPFFPISSSLHAPGFSLALWFETELEGFEIWCRFFFKVIVSDWWRPVTRVHVLCCDRKLCFYFCYYGFDTRQACAFCINRYGAVWIKFKWEKCFALPLMLSKWSKAVLLQAWSGPEGSRKLRFPQDGGKVVILTHRSPLPPGNAPGTHFC